MSSLLEAMIMNSRYLPVYTKDESFAVILSLHEP